MKQALALLLLALASTAPASAAQVTVPIYIEDSHAGSFYWLSQNLDLEEPCTLIHFDAHSDASGIFDSDTIRTRLRRVGSREERGELLSAWRKRGVIQCFNWIEPLMPSPIAEIIWVPPTNAAERKTLEANAARQLDGHLEAAGRARGSFAERCRVRALEELGGDFANGRPVIATIDLDYFAGLEPAQRAAEFARVWKFVSELRDLRAITIAISRPYLASDEEADALLQLALKGALSLPTARIRFEPFLRVGNDQSNRARELRDAGHAVPAFDLSRSPQALRALFLANQQRIAVHESSERWENQMKTWHAEAPAFHLAISNQGPSTDNIWRVSTKESAPLEIVAEPWDTELDRVQWLVEVPELLRCNLTAETGREESFARDAPPRPRWREVKLADTGKQLPLTALRSFFDRDTGAGALRIKARIEARNWIRETPTLELRRVSGTGFRAALTEQFGLPYLFGSGSLREGENTGPETGWGADCANFLIHALRRQGLRIPWSNPRQFRRYLEPIASDAQLGDAAKFSAEELDRGVVLHLGWHVAALMEDRAPLGILNADDVVAHQLEGAPALLTVGELLLARQVSRFDLLRVPSPAAGSDLVIGGDVMLGRSIGAKIERGVDPFAGIRAALIGVGKSVVNLECVITTQAPVPGKRFPLRAPMAAAATLRAAGIGLVGVANNHTSDFGPAALNESNALLRAASVSVIDTNAERFVTTDGARVTLLAVDDTGSQPCDRAHLLREISRVRSETDFLVVLAHWGEENTSLVTERQRELARWLIDHGVDLIAGSHPHCVQPLDFYRGRAIVYSLGNLVFDGAPTLASWNAGNLLQVGIGRRGTSPSLRFVPIQLDGEGLPYVLSPAATVQR